MRPGDSRPVACVPSRLGVEMWRPPPSPAHSRQVSRVKPARGRHTIDRSAWSTSRPILSSARRDLRASRRRPVRGANPDRSPIRFGRARTVQSCDRLGGSLGDARAAAKRGGKLTLDDGTVVLFRRRAARKARNPLPAGQVDIISPSWTNNNEQIMIESGPPNCCIARTKSI